MKAVKYAHKHSGLNWFDFMWCRILKNFKGENFQSMEMADMSYFLMLNEYLDMEDFINDTDQRERERIQKAEMAADRRKRGHR